MSIKVDDKVRLARAESYVAAKRAEEPDVLRAALQMAVGTGDEGTASALARAIRNRELEQCDYTQIADNPLDEAARDAWQTYRQALRDVPEQAGFPLAIVWPEKPGRR